MCNAPKGCVLLPHNTAWGVLSASLLTVATRTDEPCVVHHLHREGRSFHHTAPHVIDLVPPTSRIPFPLTTLNVLPFLCKSLSPSRNSSLYPTSSLGSPDSGSAPLTAQASTALSYYCSRKQEAGRSSTLPAQGIQRCDVGSSNKNPGLAAWLSFIVDLL